MPQLLIFVVLLMFVAIGMWFVLAGDREQDFEDEDDKF